MLPGPDSSSSSSRRMPECWQQKHQRPFGSSSAAALTLGATFAAEVSSYRPTAAVSQCSRAYCLPAQLQAAAAAVAGAALLLSRVCCLRQLWQSLQPHVQQQPLLAASAYISNCCSLHQRLVLLWRRSFDAANPTAARRHAAAARRPSAELRCEACRRPLPGGRARDCDMPDRKTQR